MCCHVHPPHGPTPGSASEPKCGQYGLMRCGEGSRIASSAAYVTPPRGAVVLTLTRSPGMVKGTISWRPPTRATPSPAAFSSSMSTTTAGRSLTSSHVEQLDVEQERGVRGDHAAGAARAVAVIRRDRQRAAAADLHAGDTLVPSADDLAAAQTERERFAPVA